MYPHLFREERVLVMTKQRSEMNIGSMGRTARRGLRRLLAGIGYSVELLSGRRWVWAEALGFGGVAVRGCRGSGARGPHASLPGWCSPG